MRRGSWTSTGPRWSLLRAEGCIIAAGSDAPVEKGNPLIEFYAATVRKPLPGMREARVEEWHREQALSREDALRALTIWPAYAAFEEDLRGSIQPGKLADLTVLDADIMQVPEAEIPRAKVIMTVIAGEVVYERSPPR